MTFHIDLGGKYDQLNCDSVLALVDENGQSQRALLIEASVKRSLLRKSRRTPDLKRWHAAFIAHLIEPYLSIVDHVVICDDYGPFSDILEHLDALLFANPQYDNTRLESLADFRLRCKSSTRLKSSADRFAGTVLKHARRRKNVHRRHRCFEFVEVLNLAACARIIKKGEESDSPTASTVGTTADYSPQ